MRLNEFDPTLTESLAVGDPVIITGDVEFRGKTGDVREIGSNGAFVVVDLYNYGPQSFQASDVSRNDYADLEDDEDVAEGSQPNDIAVYHHTGPNADKKAQAHAVKLGSEYGHFRHDQADKNDNLHIVTQKRYFPDYTKQQGVAEQEQVGNMDADKFDAAMARLKQLAGAGPLKTVYDPQKRVYRNVPTAVQPPTQPKK